MLAGGTFPGQVVKGYIGDRFQINVVNLLKDDTMIKTTTVVSAFGSVRHCSRRAHDLRYTFISDSTGMGSFNGIRTGQMEFRLSPNAPSHRATHSYTTFVYQIRQGHSGTIRMTVSYIHEVG